MPPAPVTSQYQSEHSSSSSRPHHTHRRTSSSSSNQQKVADWLPTTSTSSPNPIGYPLSPSQSPDGRKMVHWTGDVEDNEKAPRRSSKIKSSKSGSNSSKSSSSKSSSSSSSSSSKRKSSSSSNKDDSRSRVPPPAPRPARLPTPDLSDIEHGDFCDCCPPTRQTAKQKMDSQLDAAMAHIAAAKQRGY